MGHLWWCAPQVVRQRHRLHITTSNWSFTSSLSETLGPDLRKVSEKVGVWWWCTSTPFHSFAFAPPVSAGASACKDSVMECTSRYGVAHRFHLQDARKQWIWKGTFHMQHLWWRRSETVGAKMRAKRIKYASPHHRCMQYTTAGSLVPFASSMRTTCRPLRWYASKMRKGPVHLFYLLCTTCIADANRFKCPSV